LASLKNQLETFGESSEAMTFSVAPQKTGNQELTVWCPYRVRLCIRYSQEYNNSLTEAGLCFYLAHSNFGEIDGSSERDVVRRFILRPDFDHTLKLVWRDEERALTTEQLVAFVLNELAEEIDIHHNEAEANKQH
jgi:hypothetical protein